MSPAVHLKAKNQMQRTMSVKKWMMLIVALAFVAMSCNDQLNEDTLPLDEQTSNTITSRLSGVVSDTLDTSNMEEWSAMALADLPQSTQDYLNTTYSGVTVEEVWQTDTGAYVVLLENDMVVIFDSTGALVLEFDLGVWLDDDEDYDDDEDDHQDGDFVEVGIDSLSQTIIDYLGTNYPDAVVEEVLFNIAYEEYFVFLDNELIVVFDKDGNFIEEMDEDEFFDRDEEGEFTEIDLADLPQPIKDYIAANYPDQTIEEAYYDEIEEEYHVELDNELIVVFDKDGNFLREYEDD